MSKSILTQLRKDAYGLGRLLGDMSAVSSGKPSKMGKRLVNKAVGRNLISRLWWK